MITESQIKEFILLLLDCRTELLWLISQDPINERQRELIEKGKELLMQTNLFLEDFDAKIPS